MVLGFLASTGARAVEAAHGNRVSSGSLGHDYSGFVLRASIDHIRVAHGKLPLP
jgi:hypothetical protein